jgi:hypothetical protein
VTIEIYRNQSDERKVEKELIDKTELTGTFRNESSIYNPVVRVQWTQSANKINYMYIPAYDRYYYITDIVRVRDEIVDIKGRTDVLMSFKDEILNMTGIVKRSANKWNLYLDDGSLKVYNNPMISTKEFPSGFTAREFILAVAGS